MNLIQKVPFKFQTGVEMTWQPPNYEQLSKTTVPGRWWEESALGSAMHELSNTFEIHAELAMLPKHNIHSDCCHCVEYSTPVLKSWDDLEMCYKGASKIAKGMGLVPSIEYATTGMGHIHVGGLSDREKVWAMRDIVCRPYLSWALVHPSDDINAMPVSDHLKANTHPRSGKLVNRKEYWWAQNFEAGRNSYTARLPRWKDYALRHAWGYDTMEWRAFDAPQDWNEQVRQMALVQRYFDYVRQNADKPLIKLPFARNKPAIREWERGWTFDRAAGEYRQFIKDMDLPVKQYDYWIDQNMQPRFEWGVRFRTD